MPEKPFIEKQAAEIEAAADVFLAPGDGGVAVWVWRQDLQPRASIRLRGKDMDLVEAVAMFGALHQGLARCAAAFAESVGVDPLKFCDAVTDASATLAKEFDSQVRTRPSQKGAT